MHVRACASCLVHIPSTLIIVYYLPASLTMAGLLLLAISSWMGVSYIKYGVYVNENWTKILYSSINIWPINYVQVFTCQFLDLRLI